MSQPTTTRMPQSFLRLSLTAKLCVASTLLCVLCVALTSAVLGVRISHVATEQADRQASLARIFHRSPPRRLFCHFDA